jgi:hypothetical protein
MTNEATTTAIVLLVNNFLCRLHEATSILGNILLYHSENRTHRILLKLNSGQSILYESYAIKDLPYLLIQSNLDLLHRRLLNNRL